MLDNTSKAFFHLLARSGPLRKLASRYGMRSPDGQDAYGLATYERIDEPSLIAYTDAFAHADGTVDGTMPVMPVTVQFAESNGRTTLTSRIHFSSTEDAEKVAASGMEEGLTQTWDRLEGHLAAG